MLDTEPCFATRASSIVFCFWCRTQNARSRSVTYDMSPVSCASGSLSSELWLSYASFWPQSPTTTSRVETVTSRSRSSNCSNPPSLRKHAMAVASAQGASAFEVRSLVRLPSESPHRRHRLGASFAKYRDTATLTLVAAQKHLSRLRVHMHTSRLTSCPCLAHPTVPIPPPHRIPVCQLQLPRIRQETDEGRFPGA